MINATPAKFIEKSSNAIRPEKVAGSGPVKISTLKAATAMGCSTPPATSAHM